MVGARLNFASCGLAVFLSVAATGVASEGLRVDFLDVGQADAILVTCPDGDHHLLIDAGDTSYPGSSERFRSSLNQILGGPSAEIDVVVASHMHRDHIGSMAWVLGEFKVGTYVDNGDTAETNVFDRLVEVRRRLVDAGQLTYVNARRNSFATIQYCPHVKMTILEPWARQRSLSGKNDRSVMVRLDYRNKSFLFAGDIEKAAERVMLERLSKNQRALLDVDVLKVGHHASDTSSTVAFIAAVSPDLAIVSCGGKGIGTNVRYKHPRASTLLHYQNWFTDHPPSVGAESDLVWAYDAERRRWMRSTRPAGVCLTIIDGAITIQTDGERLNVETQNP